MKNANYLIIAIIAIAIVGIFIIFPPSSMSVADIEQNPYAWLTEYTKPNDPAVISALEQIIEPDGVLSIKDVYDLQSWIGTNIRYTTAEPTYPSDTLSSGSGNCWSQASLMYSFVLAEDPDADSYIALIDVTADGSSYVHCSVISYFTGGVIISDTTIGPTVNTYCKLESQESAVNRIVTGTNADTYIITNIINMEGEK